MMVCKTPAALEMAIKAAAKASPLETGRAVSGFYFHRLLCRVFSKPDSPFMLKGGQSMLARTMDARATRDIDLLSEEADLDAALAELRALAEADLGDFVVFEFVGAVPIKVEDEYRSDRFSVPDEWKQLYEGAFKKLVSRTGLSSELSDIAAAEALAASLFDPVLARKAGDLHWDHESLSWEGLVLEHGEDGRRTSELLRLLHDC